MSQYKSNHYIPRFYLRSFTNNPSNKHGFFDLFNTKNPKHIGYVDHYPQMKEEYFYPKDSPIENLLNKDFETKHAKLINKVLKNDIINNDELVEIVLLMYFRTKQNRDDTQAFRKFCIDNYLIKSTESFRNYLANEIPYINFSTIPDKELIEYMRRSAYENYANDKKTAEKNIEDFQKVNTEISGLKALIIKSTTSSLISSDHPVICINPFLQSRVKNLGIYGLFQMGIILLLPINPDNLIICFDNKIYKESLMTTLTKSDIDNLNKLQVINSREVVYTKKFDLDMLNLINKNIECKIQPKIISYKSGDYYVNYIDKGLPEIEFDFIKTNENLGGIQLQPPFARENLL